MKLENYELHLPSYSVGKEVYNQIGKICKPYGTKVLVIGGKKALSAAFDKISFFSDKMRRTEGWVLSEKKFTEQTARMRQ